MTTAAGFATFGILGYHLSTRHVVTIAVIPVVYAVAMGVDALAAFVSGWLYDRFGLDVLVAVPILSILVPFLALTTAPAPAIAGILVWGAVLGIQESTMRAAVAAQIPAGRRGTA